MPYGCNHLESQLADKLLIFYLIKQAYSFVLLKKNKLGKVLTFQMII